MDAGRTTRRGGIALAWVTLLLLAAQPMLWGWRAVRMPERIRAETPPGATTTGPYSEEELRWAESTLSMVADPKDLTQAQLEQAAEVFRKRQADHRAEWERERSRRLSEAEARVGRGYWLMLLSGGLMAVWTWIAARLWSSAGRERQTGGGA